MLICALKTCLNALASRLSKAIVARGLRPEVAAALLDHARLQAQTQEDEQLAAEWLLRKAVPNQVAEIILTSITGGESSHKISSEVNPSSRQWAYWVSRQCTALDANGTLRMPLLESVNSDQTAAKFFDGENIQVMQGSIVSVDSRIGANTYVGFNCHITKARIGRYVSIADNVMIGPGEHRLDRISTHSLFYDAPYETLTEAPCVIEDDAWIGAACIIRRGVTIGTGAVIGANSFVNKDVLPFAIMAGSPARYIGSRFDEQTAERILASRWWKLPADEARALIEQLTQQISS